MPLHTSLLAQTTLQASRRRFLKNTGLALTGLAFQAHCFHRLTAPDASSPGLQLWSIRDDLAHDLGGILAAVAGIGFREVEGFGYQHGKLFGMTLANFLQRLRKQDLTMRSCHRNCSLKDFDVKKNTLTDAAKSDLDAAAANGLKYLVWAWVAEDERSDFPRLMQTCRALAAYARSLGLGFAWHNHAYEFELRGPDQRLLLEWLLQEIDPALLDFEMDVYWVAFAGQDPLEWIKRYPGRWKLCHLKDMARTPERQTIEVGDGSIDFTAIVKEREQAGFQYLFVELEHYATTALEGMARSREGVLRLLEKI